METFELGIIAAQISSVCREKLPKFKDLDVEAQYEKLLQETSIIETNEADKKGMIKYLRHLGIYLDNKYEDSFKLKLNGTSSVYRSSRA